MAYNSTIILARRLLRAYPSQFSITRAYFAVSPRSTATHLVLCHDIFAILRCLGIV